MRGGRPALLLCLLALAAMPVRSRADDISGGEEAAPSVRRLEEPPRYGLYYDRREPSFYTGFAPRTYDPARMHVHLGRGNQLRVTLVLSDDVLREYARDLAVRDQTYRTLVDEGRIELSQNVAFEDFERRLGEIQLRRLVTEEKALSPAQLRERNLALLERLNPGRVFRIRMPVDEVVRRWAAQVRPEDRERMDNARRLELLNLMLPTRLWIAELDGGTAKAFDALVHRAPVDPAAPGAVDAIRPDFLAVLDRVAPGLYPEQGGALRFDEFTAIYPVGTFNDYTTWHGRRIPQYPTPGRRALTTHQRTKTVDHVPTDESYAYLPWLPYMHVGSNMHNAVHTLWWRMDPAQTAFLPVQWRVSDRGSRDGTPWHYLWLLSRGPMSHGCTHLNAGHISELRQMLPSDTERLYDVDTFLNKSYLYDVFDINGDFEPEVMGVRYFIAYSLRGKKPDRLRVRDERHAYYDWLYGGEVKYDADDRGFFRDVRDGHFVGRSAVDGAEYDRISLREAAYESERIQFYHLIDIPFARELRKVGLRHPFPGAQVSAAGGG
jgi:hypothetical protein